MMAWLLLKSASSLAEAHQRANTCRKDILVVAAAASLLDSQLSVSTRSGQCEKRRRVFDLFNKLQLMRSCDPQML